MRRALRYMVLAVLSGAATPSLGEIQKTVRLQSDPPGAQVYLLRGSQRIPVGTTPLDYAAEFHSEISILRFAFERAGFAPKTMEVSAGQDSVVAPLARRNFAADPATHQDERLRQLQQRLNPLFEDAVAALLSRPEWGLDIAGFVRLRRLDNGQLYVQVPITVSTSSELNRARQDAQSDALVLQLWNGPGKQFVSSLRSKLATGTLDGIILQAEIASTSHQFGVGGRVETATEMVCVPGTKQVYDACARYEDVLECRPGSSCRKTGTRCVPGMRYALDPCATRAPATKTTLKVDPMASTTASRVRLLVISPLDPSRSSSAEKPSLLQLDGSGRTVFSQGEIPDQLVSEIRRK